MNTFIDLLLLAVTVCFIVDCSGIMTDIRKLAAKVIHKRTGIKVEYSELKLKPFGCSLCSVWWTGIIYTLVTGQFTIVNTAFTAVLALLASNISGFLFTVKDFLATIGCKIQEAMKTSMTK